MEYLIESFKYGLTPAIIILIYLLVTRYLDHKKEIKRLEKEKEEATKTVKINAEIIDCFNELNTYLKHITKDIIEKEDDKCVTCIRSSFKAMSYSVSKFATFTILKNNVTTNKKNILDNIENVVAGEFTNIYNSLVLYNTNDLLISTFVKEEWKEQVIDDLKYIIFDESSSKEDRIYDIHNKLNIRVNAYVTSVTNQYLKK